MAVFTFITPEQLSVFLRDYDLGELVRFEGIQQGVSNTNYHVWTARGHYILTLFEKRVDPLDLPFFFSYTDHLFRHGIHCPHAIPNQKGEIFGAIADRAAVLVNFLEEVEVPLAEISVNHCRRLGALVAQMHLAAKDFLLTRSNAMGLSKWRELAKLTAARADEVEGGLAALMTAELAYVAKEWPALGKMPQAAVHADIFPDNVLFGSDDIPAIIDFYFSCTDFLIYDLALTVNAWCFDGDNKFRPAYFSAFMKSYQEQRPLEAVEKQNFTLMCRAAALRIVSTRLHDWLFPRPESFVKPKNPHDYIARLKFHQHEQILS